MDPTEYYQYEDRYYQVPTLTRDETLNFVDSLRNTVQRNNAGITKSTQALGTNITPNLGGLTGSEGYFAQRYQTTPMEYQVNTLKATAQADALNKLMTNYKNQAANKYQQAYRKAARAAAAGGGGTGDDGTYNKVNSEYTSELGATINSADFPSGASINGIQSTAHPGYIEYLDKNNGNQIVGVLHYVNGELVPISANDPYYELSGNYYIDKSSKYHRDVVNRGKALINASAITSLFNPLLGIGLYQGGKEFIY